jgi:branched-subunit amino acid aminotransferase/4-amino-4-deoxychorismate lyase
LKIIPLDSAHFYQSNSMNRGVQTFTSFLSDSSQFIFLQDHLDRLLKGADFLFPKENLLNQRPEIIKFLESEFSPSNYFRLSISEDTIIFTKKPHAPKQPFVSLANAQSLKAPSLVPSFIKSSNYLLAELELLEAKKRKCDDVVFFDQQNNVTEASTSNIFAVLDEKTILTPKTSSMVLEGITRKRLIEFLSNSGFNLIETDISRSELESSLEIWLTNAIQGLRLVERYESQDMFREKTIYQTVCQKFGRFGERYNYEKRN